MCEDTPNFPPPLLCCLFNNESTAFSNVQVKLLIRVGRGESCRSKESPKINKESLPKEPSMSNIFTNVDNNLLPKRIFIIISEIIEVNQLFGV